VGISKAKGKFITILSADDMRESWGLENLYRVVEKDNKLVPYDDMMLVKAGERMQRQRLHEYNFDKLIYKNQMPAGIMFLKAAWEQVGGYPEEMRYGREDWGFAVALGVHGYCGVRINSQPGYLYRREGQNRSRRNQGPSWYQRFLRQIQNRFPEIYRGEKPMACCGGRNNKQPVAKASSNNMVAKTGGSKTTIPGASGFVLIEYIGTNAGDMKWKPTGSNTKYVFGGSRKIGNVAQEHLDWFLGLSEKQKPLFRLAPVAPVKIPKVEVQAVNQPVPPSYDHLAEYYTYSLAKLKQIDLRSDEWQHLLDKELSKVNQRATVVKWLESKAEVELV
jgi:hypothetical protein